MLTLTSFLDTFEEFRSATWSSWKQILERITPAVREGFFIVGRGGGKSRIAAAIAVFYGTQRDYTTVPGERIYVAVVAPDRKQAGVTFNYIRGLLLSVPHLASLVDSETNDSIDLLNGVTIEVVTASISAPRGRSYALVVVEEAAFLRDEYSSNPDVELLAALRPALARVPGSLLLVISSPYARRGVLYEAWRRDQEQRSEDTLVVRASTLDLNPKFDRKAIEREYERDPQRADAEYGANFRTDVESVFTVEAIDAVTPKGIFERPLDYRCKNVRAFVDPSGGSSDSFTLAVAATVDQIETLLCVREWPAPFSPANVVEEAVDVLQRYHLREVSGDGYSGEIIREQFRRRGVEYLPSPLNRSGIYLDALAVINSKECSLLDLQKLRVQLLGLERRVNRTVDSIDHRRGEHDDVANAAMGALVVGREAGVLYDCTW